MELTDRWMSLPLSLLGRINIQKINTLPKLLYLFQNIPLPPPGHFFQKLRKLFIRFILKNDWARIWLSVLHLLYNKGGLKCPHIFWYYWAVQFRTIEFYFATRDVPQWKEMESEGLSLPLPLYLYSDTLPNLMKQTTNPIVKNMIKVYFEVKKNIKGPGILSQYSPIWGNQCFTPGRADVVFRTWASKGLEKIQDMFLPNTDNMM